MWDIVQLHRQGLPKIISSPPIVTEMLIKIQKLFNLDQFDDQIFKKILDQFDSISETRIIFRFNIGKFIPKPESPIVETQSPRCALQYMNRQSSVKTN